MTWENLTGNFTATQVHCCTETPLVGTAGPATILVEWPYGGQTTSGNIGSYADTTNLFFFDAAFFAANGGTTEGAEEALLKGFQEGRAYQNILTSTYPAGEIRGFLVVPVPEPERTSLIGVGLAVLACLKRRRI